MSTKRLLSEGRYCSMDWFSGKVLHVAWRSLEPVYKLDVKMYGPDYKARQRELTSNVKIIRLQTPIWKVSCHRSIISGLLNSGNGKWQGFLNGLLRKPAKASRIVYIFWLNQNLFERSNWVNLNGATRLRNIFCQDKKIITFKNSSCTW